MSAIRLRSSDAFSVGNTSTKSSSNLSLPTNILFSLSHNKITAPPGDLFHTFNKILLLKKVFEQVPPALINLTPLRPLKTFLDIAGVSEVNVLKDRARFPLGDRKTTH